MNLIEKENRKLGPFKQQSTRLTQESKLSWDIKTATPYTTVKWDNIFTVLKKKENVRQGFLTQQNWSSFWKAINYY